MEPLNSNPPSRLDVTQSTSAILLAVLFTSAKPDDRKRRDRQRDYPDPDAFMGIVYSLAILIDYQYY